MSDSFEKNLNKLEEIVEKLERGTSSLDEALLSFEEGIKLSKLCHKKLDSAEKEVEILLKKENEIVGRENFK